MLMFKICDKMMLHLLNDATSYNIDSYTHATWLSCLE